MPNNGLWDTWPNRYSGQGRFLIEYRRCTDNNWTPCYSCPELEGGQEYFTREYPGQGGRDYVIRLRDQNTNWIYIQLGPSYLYTNRPSNRWPEDVDLSNIDWNEPVLANPGDLVPMIKVGCRRIGGKLHLLVNAKEFHDELDKIGVAHNTVEYLDQPATASQVATSAFQLSPRVLLRRDYRDVEVVEMKAADAPDKPLTKEVVKMPITGMFDLSGVFAAPPSIEQLKKLCNSAYDTARKILEHYQPIDISVEIQKKLIK